MPRTPTNKEPKCYLLTIRVNKEEFERIKENAAVYTAGNVSHWGRWRMVYLDPLPDIDELLQEEQEAYN